MKQALIVFICLFLIYWIATMVVPHIIEKDGNPVKSSLPYIVPPDAMALSNSYDIVEDLHCDALLWGIPLTKRSDYGHVDFPRMQEGNVRMQVFTVVSKSPKGQNMEANTADSTDNNTLPYLAQGRLVSNWFSLMKKTLYQSAKMEEFSGGFEGQFIIIKSKEDVLLPAESRKTDKNIIGGLLGIEGGLALEGKIENLDKAREEGVRIIGPSHFFDNELGGSSSGMSRERLTDFGKAVVKRMDELNMIIDLVQASPKMFDDVLTLSTKPVTVSHTGIRAVLNSPRNLSDDRGRRLAAKIGVIGIAFFQMAGGEDEIRGIVACMNRVKNLVGIDHMALGSEYDGNVAVPFDITGLPIIFEALMQE